MGSLLNDLRPLHAVHTQKVIIGHKEDVPLEIDSSDGAQVDSYRSDCFVRIGIQLMQIIQLLEEQVLPISRVLTS